MYRHISLLCLERFVNWFFGGKKWVVKQKYLLSNICRIVSTPGCTDVSAAAFLNPSQCWVEYSGLAFSVQVCHAWRHTVDEDQMMEDKCLVCVQAPCDNGSKIQNYILQWDEVVMPFQILHCLNVCVCVELGCYCMQISCVHLPMW